MHDAHKEPAEVTLGDLVDVLELIHDAHSIVRNMLRDFTLAAEARTAHDEQRDRLREEIKVEREELKVRRAGWRQMSRCEQEQMVLTILGEDGLTARDVTLTIEANLGDGAVREHYVRVFLGQMVEAGQLCRVAEKSLGKTRYRYFREALTGPIAELEREFNDKRGGAA
jgi:hypothetical protein